MKSVASATIIVMALLVTTTNGSLLRDSKGKLLLKAKATTKATAKATTKAQGVHVRGHTGATVVDTWTANTAAWNDRIYRVTDFGRFTTSNYQYFVKTSVTRRGHSIPLESTFAARYVVITETAMHSSITNSHACPSSWKTAAAGSGFVKHDLYGYSSGFATFGTYCSYVDVSAGSQIIVPAGGEKKFIFVKSLECSIKFDMCKLGTPTNCIRVNIPRLVCEYLQPHDWCRQHGACTPADDMYDIDN